MVVVYGNPVGGVVADVNDQDRGILAARLEFLVGERKAPVRPHGFRDNLTGRHPNGFAR